MELLATDDPVYVVDLTEAALAACRAAFDDANLGTDPAFEGTDPNPQRGPKKRPIRAVAFLTEADADPVLVPITPTRDVMALDAMARLVRAAVVTGVPVAELATRHGDGQLTALYRARRLPAFVYTPSADLPAWLTALLA